MKESMQRGQMLGMMFMIGLVIAIAFGILYLLVGGLEGPRSSGLGPELSGYLQECAASASDCALVRLGEFGGGMILASDPLDVVSNRAGSYLARNSLGCVGNRAKLTGESFGSASFNQEDTTTVLSVPSGYHLESEEGRFEKFSSLVDARYRAVRGLEGLEREAPGRTQSTDVNLDFLAVVEGTAAIHES